MIQEQYMVRQFHKKFGQPINDEPTFNLDPELLAFRARLIEEECKEFLDAVDQNNFTEMIDALGDIMYTVYGAANALGVDLEPVFAEVHRSNMTKVWPDGTVRRREDGKVIKPPTYSRADVAGEILKQIPTWNKRLLAKEGIVAEG